MKIGIPKESQQGESRVAITPDIASRFVREGSEVFLETGAGEMALFSDEDYQAVGVKTVERGILYGCDAMHSIHPISKSELPKLNPGMVLVSLFSGIESDYFRAACAAKISILALERIPRISRAQSMDVLSSQANIAGYRAVIEAASRYSRFFPLMMTSAGSSRPAKLLVLGVGVAGLQAIATSRRLGAQVTAYDIREETKEQVKSLGAKFLELDVGETGSGHGGYAKELTDEGKKQQQEALNSTLSSFNIIITTANIPGRKAPTLITEAAVEKMNKGTLIIDMAAESGGNCPLTECGLVVEKNGVTFVGITNYPALVPSDSSQFFARNIYELMKIVNPPGGKFLDTSDEIIDAALLVFGGEQRKEVD